ncbi:unnamed protein product [Urochloa decumbens]|uniref:Uncharacterized protein n=1 Tax=Urochloa decumbens TaxID=240449 RepID=A0ABC9BU69_9POAL
MSPLLLLSFLLAGTAAASPSPPPPVPPRWPEQYHAVLVTNQTDRGGRLRQIGIYYDWPRGRALNYVRDQLSDDPVVDVQWANGTSFLFDRESCETVQYATGLQPPDWASRAAYLGRELVDGFECDVWSNFYFVRYDVDVATGRPVSWVSVTEGTRTRRHVLSFEPGAVMSDDSKFQAPAHCFSGRNADASAFLLGPVSSV